jgi:hypothetical protein
MPLPAPVRPLRCKNPDCSLPEGGRCARLAEFPNPEPDCTDLVRVAEAAASRPPAAMAPWTGRHLDPAEAERLLWRSPARLVGVLGPSNAGKTCLLTSFFLQLANGQRGSFPYRFASSLTLFGFRELMERAGQWSGNAQENIVDRTTIGADELAPRAFLHLGLRPENRRDDRHIDLLLSDFPGEWFKAWSASKDDTTGRRMTFIRRCDAFLVLVDAGALMEQGGGRLDNETSILIRRLIESTQDLSPRPPLALIFSKVDRIVRDIQIPPAGQRLEPRQWGKLADKARRTWIALAEAQRAGLTVEVFPVSAFPHRLAEGQPVGVMEPFTYAMRHADKRALGPRLEVPVPEGASGFTAVRRWRDTP